MEYGNDVESIMNAYQPNAKSRDGEDLDGHIT